MKIGVISDSHDHLPNLRHALTQLSGRGIETVIHCGDLIAPFVTVELGKFAGQVHTVFGNNDGDRFLSQKVAKDQASGSVTHHGEVGLLELDGLRVAFSHYSGHARGHAIAQGCQVALFGHTHLYHHSHGHEQEGDLVVLNPGELLGMKGTPSFCILDTATRNVERCTFSTQPWPSVAWS